MKVIKKFFQFLTCLLPTIGMVVIQYGVAFTGIIIYAIILALSGQSFNFVPSTLLDGNLLMVISASSQIITLIVALLIYLLALKQKRFNRFTNTFSLKTLPGLVFVCFGLAVLTSCMLEVVYLISPSVIEAYSELMEDIGISDRSVLALVSTLILAPVTEELVFRGVTMSLARRFTKKFWLANFIQAACFGIAHGNIVQGIYAFIFALVLGYMYKSYNSIVITMICHFLYNLMGGYVISYVMGESETLQILRFFITLLLSSIVTYWGFCIVGREKKRLINIDNYNIRSEEFYTNANRKKEKKKDMVYFEESGDFNSVNTEGIIVEDTKAEE